MSIGSWRVAVRVAARSALRDKGRTFLVAAMVGLPVMGASMADTLYRTAELTPAQQVDREVGRGDYLATLDTPRKARRAAAAVDALAAEGVAATTMHSGSLDVVVADRSTISLSVEQLDLESPVYAGRVRLLAGEVPRAPDEVVVTDRLAQELDAGLGDVVRLGEHDVRVVGTAVTPSFTVALVVFPAAETVLEDTLIQRAWVLDAPTADGDRLARTLRAVDMEVVPRAELVRHAARQAQLGIEAADVGTAVVVVGLGVLQVVLLAAVAFTVGARRQRRDLGLVAVQGGSRADRRAMVLASGLVIGMTASLAGAIAGVGLARLTAGPVERLGDAHLGPFEVAPRDLLVIVTIGVATALAAAALPAWSASRVPPLDALTGHRTPPRPPRRLTAVGVAGVLAGASIAWAGARGTASYEQILVGAVVTELGFVLCTSALVGAVGRVAGRLPLAPRLGLRDAARNRGRSAPAVAAIMTAIAATVGLTTFGTSDQQRSEDLYARELPADVVVVRVDGVADQVLGVASRVAAELPGGTVHAVPTLTSPCRPDEWVGDCTNTLLTLPPAPGTGPGPDHLMVAVGGPEVAEVLLGRPDARAAEVLVEGRAVVLGRPGAEGELHVVTVEDDESIPLLVEGIEAADHPALPRVIVPSSTADKLGLVRGRVEHLVRTSRAPSRADVDAAARAGRAVDPSTWLWVDRGPESQWPLVLSGLVAASLVVTLGASAIVTVLAKSEAGPDLATLSAVGASPGVRRRLVAAQAGTVAFLGAATGVPAGLVPAVAVLVARSTYPVVVPWGVVCVLVLGTTLLAAAVAGLFTRSRLPSAARRA